MNGTHELLRIIKLTCTFFLHSATHSSSEKFLNNLDLEKLLGNAADVFIVFGAILLFVVFWGCFGVSCKSKCGLYMVLFFQSVLQKHSNLIYIVIKLNF